MVKSKIILFSIMVLTTFMYANPFSTSKDYLRLNNSEKSNFYVVNPIPDFTMSRAKTLNDSELDLYISSVFNLFPDSVDILNIENTSIVIEAEIFPLVEVGNESNVLDRVIDFYTGNSTGRTNITLTAYADSTGVDSASDTFQVAVENGFYQWKEGGSNYSFQPQYCVGSGSSPWKAAVHISLGDESYLLKEIEFGFALPENVKWKIVKFDEVPIDSILIGNYKDSLDVNPTSPTYQVIDTSFTETILTGEIAIVFSSEGNFMSLDPNAESSNTWIYSESTGWALANSYTSAYNGAWYAGMQLEKVINPEDIDYIDEGFETGTFELENWDTNWEVKYNKESDGGLNGTNLVDPIPTEETWGINSQSDYLYSGRYSAAISFASPDFNWLISPRMLLGYDDYFLNFWLWFKSSDYPTKFNVMINDNINGWVNLLSYDGSTPDNLFQSEIDISLSEYIGKIVRIAFVTEDNDGDNVAVDDIRITSPTDIDYFKHPISIVLEQNYPNPFNPTTEISFTLNHNSLTKLRVFNSSGEIVKTLNDGNLAKGYHSFNFDGRDLNSGLYFYQLEADGVRSTKKMILMK